MTIYPFDILAVHRLVPPTRLPCLAASTAHALAIARQAFPGYFVTIHPRGPQPPLQSA